MPVSRKKYILVLVLSALCFLAALLIALRFSRGVGSDTVRLGEHPLRISEFMANNTAYPNPDGVFCDWVEIENNSDHPFNVSGYRLSDDITRARYAFPVGTVIPAGGRIVVWCTVDRTGPFYAPFSIRKQGGETLLLMNSANTVLDRVDTLRCPRNLSLIRLDDDSLTVSAAPTPGYPNDEAGYAAYLASTGQGVHTVRLSEIMSAEKLICGPAGLPWDWIEVENTGPENADLSGMHLSDKEGEGRYTFPEGTILPPGGYLVVWCSGEENPDGYAPFRLSKLGGETVILSDGTGTALDRVQLPYLMDDTTYARVGGEWIVSADPTPGYPNDEAGYAAWVASLGYGDVRVQFTEICPKNLTSLRDADGDYPDWIELRNFSDRAVSLEGWYLSDNPEKPARWRMPAVTLGAGERLVIFASGKDRVAGELHTDFSVSAGETLTLLTPIGVVADRVEIPGMAQDHSWARTDGGWTESAAPTPGE